MDLDRRNWRRDAKVYSVQTTLNLKSGIFWHTVQQSRKKEEGWGGGPVLKQLYTGAN